VGGGGGGGGGGVGGGGVGLFVTVGVRGFAEKRAFLVKGGGRSYGKRVGVTYSTI